MVAALSLPSFLFSSVCISYFVLHKKASPSVPFSFLKISFGLVFFSRLYYHINCSLLWSNWIFLAVSLSVGHQFRNFPAPPKTARVLWF